MAGKTCCLPLTNRAASGQESKAENRRLQVSICHAVGAPARSVVSCKLPSVADYIFGDGANYDARRYVQTKYTTKYQMYYLHWLGMQI